jgi:hypothetical protein
MTSPDPTPVTDVTEETNAMRRIDALLNRLDERARMRVVRWAGERYTSDEEDK